MTDGSEMVFSFWYKGNLSPYEILTIKSALAQGYTYKLLTYNPDINAPQGTQVIDLSKEIPEDQVLTYESGSPALFSNLLRYQKLTDENWWWLDLDVVLLHRLPAGNPLYAAWQDEDTVGTAVLFVQEKELSAALVNNFHATREKQSYGETGPKLFRDTLLEEGRGDQILPPPIFYPVGWPEAYRLFDPEEEDLGSVLKDSCAVHFWNEMIRRMGISKQLAPPRGSFIADQLDAYGLYDAFSGQYRASTFQSLIENYRATLERDQLRRKYNMIRGSKVWTMVRPIKSLLGQELID